MSAFIVSDKVINRIVNYLNRNPSVFRHVFHDSGYKLDDSDDLARLALDIYTLNYDAVNERYAHVKGALPGESDLSFQFRLGAEGLATPVQVFKSFQCLIYQCSEGDVPERPLYALLEKAASALASEIIRKLPQYDKCTWDD